MILRGSELGEISAIHEKKPIKNNGNEKFIINLNMSKLFKKLKARGRERKLKLLKSRKYRKSEKPKTKTRKYNKFKKSMLWSRTVILLQSVHCTLLSFFH